MRYLVRDASSPKTALYIWCVFLILVPFYLFGSGMPQPADWVMAILFIYILIKNWLPRDQTVKILIQTLGLFVLYVVLVNTIWALFIDQSYEKRFPSYFHSLFYIFNFFALRSVIIAFQRYKDLMIKYTAYAIGSSMVIQTALALLTGSISSRTPLYFNNPNQLGYYALLAGSLLAFLVRFIKVNPVFQIVSFLSFFFLTLLSASKAALVGSILLIGLSLINQGLFSFRQFIIISITIGAGYYFIKENTLGSELYQYSFKRFQTIGTSRDDSIEGRGYDRMLNEPEYMIVGAGEGGYYRFKTALETGEIHSSVGTLLFCYGMVGFFLFLRFIFKVFKGLAFFELLYFLPVFAYSFTHQGLRSTLFWTYLATIFIVNYELRKAKFSRIASSKNTPYNNGSSVAAPVAGQSAPVPQ